MADTHEHDLAVILETFEVAMLNCEHAGTSEHVAFRSLPNKSCRRCDTREALDRLSAESLELALLVADMADWLDYHVRWSEDNTQIAQALELLARASRLRCGSREDGGA